MPNSNAKAPNSKHETWQQNNEIRNYEENWIKLWNCKFPNGKIIVENSDKK